MMVPPHTLPSDLLAEIEEVNISLDAVAEALNFPLNNLVRAEISKAQPFARAWVVLAVAYDDSEGDRLREQRIHLASALEILHIALSIHKLLLPTAEAYQNQAAESTHASMQESEDVQQADKLVMGSTILAGDYCFSRSADMATKTGNPEIVNIFAEALKSVSEAHLRNLFDDSAISKQEENTILVAGIKAASKLTDAPESALNTHIELCKILTDSLKSTNGQTTSRQEQFSKYAENLSTSHLNRWHQIINGLTSQ